MINNGCLKITLQLQEAYAILLGRMKVKKGMKRMNRLPCPLLSSLTQTYRENCYLHYLAKHYHAELIP